MTAAAWQALFGGPCVPACGVALELRRDIFAGVGDAQASFSCAALPFSCADASPFTRPGGDEEGESAPGFDMRSA